MRPSAPSQYGMETPAKKRQRISGFFTPVRTEASSTDRKPDEFAAWVSSVKIKAYKALRESIAADSRKMTFTKAYQSPLEERQSAETPVKAIERADLVEHGHTLLQSHTRSPGVHPPALRALPVVHHQSDAMQKSISQGTPSSRQRFRDLYASEVQKTMCRFTDEQQELHLNKTPEHIVQMPPPHEHYSSDSYRNQTLASEVSNPLSEEQSRPGIPPPNGHTIGVVHLSSNPNEPGIEVDAESSDIEEGSSSDDSFKSALDFAEQQFSHIETYQDDDMCGAVAEGGSHANVETFEGLDEAENVIAENAREHKEEFEKDLTSDEGPMLDIIHESHDLNADLVMLGPDIVEQDATILHENEAFGMEEEEAASRGGRSPLPAVSNEATFSEQDMTSFYDSQSDDSGASISNASKPRQFLDIGLKPTSGVSNEELLVKSRSHERTECTVDSREGTIVSNSQGSGEDSSISDEEESRRLAIPEQEPLPRPSQHAPPHIVIESKSVLSESPQKDAYPRTVDWNTIGKGTGPKKSRMNRSQLENSDEESEGSSTMPSEDSDRVQESTQHSFKAGAETGFTRVFLKRNLRKSTHFKSASQTSKKLEAGGQVDTGNQPSKILFPVSDPWTCFKCSLFFPDFYQRVKHDALNHIGDRQEAKCPFEGCRVMLNVANRQKLSYGHIAKHVENVHGVFSWHPICRQCLYCSLILRSGNECADHMATMHRLLDPRPFRCLLAGCPYAAWTSSTLFKTHFSCLHSSGVSLSEVTSAQLDSSGAVISPGSASLKLPPTNALQGNREEAIANAELANPQRTRRVRQNLTVLLKGRKGKELRWINYTKP